MGWFSSKSNDLSQAQQIVEIRRRALREAERQRQRMLIEEHNRLVREQQRALREAEQQLREQERIRRIVEEERIRAAARQAIRRGWL